MRSHAFAVWFAALALVLNLWASRLLSTAVASVATVLVLAGAVVALHFGGERS